MSDYHAMDGDDTYAVVVDGIDSVGKSTQKMRRGIALLASRDSPALRAGIEDEHRRGQDQIAEVKAEFRGAQKTQRLAQAEQQFRDRCADFRDTFQDYKRAIAGQASIANDEYGGDGQEGMNRGAGGGGSQQSLTMLMESDDVDAIMAAENMADAARLAQDTAAIRETMVDINDLIEEGGEQLMQIDDEIEDAAEATEQAAKELDKAREHQKSSIKLKLAIGICCGVVLLVVLFVLLWHFGVFAPKTTPPAPST